MLPESRYAQDMEDLRKKNKWMNEFRHYQWSHRIFCLRQKGVDNNTEDISSQVK